MTDDTVSNLPTAKTLHVYALQPDVMWHSPQQNRERFAEQIELARPDAGSLVILPEAATTGFTNDVSGMSDTDRETSNWLAGLSRQYNCHFLCGVINTDPLSGLGQNQAILASPTGATSSYTKVNPFPLSREDDYFTAGDEVSVLKVGEASVCPLICYDLRFPETFRRGVGADVFVLIANWPASRMHHWHALLRARAIENQAYVVGVNRTGTDPTVQYAGGSVIFDYDGHVVKEMDERPGAMATRLDLTTLREYRKKLPFLPKGRRQTTLAGA